MENQSSAPRVDVSALGVDPSTLHHVVLLERILHDGAAALVPGDLRVE
jgi:hypothetical protein